MSDSRLKNHTVLQTIVLSLLPGLLILAFYILIGTLCIKYNWNDWDVTVNFEVKTPSLIANSRHLEEDEGGTVLDLYKIKQANHPLFDFVKQEA